MAFIVSLMMALAVERWKVCVSCLPSISNCQLNYGTLGLQFPQFPAVGQEMTASENKSPDFLLKDAAFEQKSETEQRSGHQIRVERFSLLGSRSFPRNTKTNKEPGHSSPAPKKPFSDANRNGKISIFHLRLLIACNFSSHSTNVYFSGKLFRYSPRLVTLLLSYFYINL